MNKLESIVLSNLRKFGPNVEIKLSPGATIVLAPNGTGKTTLFEAIELGLTGKIARLHDDIHHVIRDDEASAQVSLNFTDFTATSKVTSDGQVFQEGDMTTLFPGIPQNDLPFLLRLTHLLDQRENEWIVKADEKDAGSQLAKLPIGREGSRAGTTLPSVRRSLNEQKNREQQALFDLEKELQEWNQLLQERDVAAAGVIGVLRPQEHLAKAISTTAIQTQVLDQIPSGLLSKPVSQDSLALSQFTLLEILRTKINRIQALIVNLAEADSLIENFNTVKARLDTLNSQLAIKKETLDNHVKFREGNTILLQNHQNDSQTAQQTRINVIQALDQLVKKAGAQRQFEHWNQALTDATTAVRNAEERCSALREKHDRNLQIQNQHFHLDNQLKSLVQTEEQLSEGQRLVERWEATEQRLKQNQQESALLEKELGRLDTELANKRTTQQTCKAAEEAARINYQALSASVDAIRQAVASIVEHLPSEQESCPLCLYPHGAAELQERVTEALQAINPNLTSADQRLRNAVNALVASDAEVIAALEAVQNCQISLKALTGIRQVLEQEIVLFRTDPILVSDSVSLAKESLKVRLDGVLANRKNLIDRRSDLEPFVTQETFEQVKYAFDTAITKLDQARAQHSETLTRLNQAVATLSTLASDAPVTGTLEELTTQQKQLDEQISKLSAQIVTTQSELEIQQRKQQELHNAVEITEEAIRHAQTRLASLRTNWKTLELEGDPLAEVAQTRVNALRSTLVGLESNLEQLEKLGLEISAWGKLNESQLAQRLIDAQRLNCSEEEFSANLIKKISTATTQLADLTQISEAMDSLDSLLKKELGNVQKHIGKVVPRWQGLLKRVVREPRFHEASLNFFTYYNKEKAEVSVPLGKQLAPVPNVASEAQLTDLQLTFLLAMAMSHQWSPWKALLLDDPTQHHDLVHASAVFDVLRDYIIDHGFQIIIATHDALQARYFLRKLQNDGIEARILTLLPTAHGVSAEEGSRRQ